MKHLITLALFILVSAMTFAQTDNVQSVVVRQGDKYTADGMLMNQEQFMGYLQTRDAISYDHFRKAYNLANVGWQIFGCGLVVCAAGMLCTIYSNQLYKDYGIADRLAAGADPDHLNQFERAAINMRGVGIGLDCAGAAITGSSIVCLGVGYYRMHSTVDMYNNSKNRKPAVSLNLQSSRDGLGLALRF